MIEAYYIPAKYGGRLQSFEEMFTLLRVISRRAMAVAIAHVKTYMGSVWTWRGGSELQKHRLAQKVRNQEQIALDLTERSHGSDLLANETRAIHDANGYPIFTIPYTQRLLVDAFLDLLICDCVTIAANRALHVATEQMSVWSAVTKYFVPTTVETVIQQLSVVLGARNYVRDGHWAGIFQKMIRDNAIVSVFDGSIVVNLYAIAFQLRQLANQRKGEDDAYNNELFLNLQKIFSLNESLPSSASKNLVLTNGGNYCILQDSYSSLDHIKNLEKYN